MNNYLGKKYKITLIKDLTPDTKLFRLNLKNFKFLPGQFVMLSILGYGEGPFSITSSPTKNRHIDLTIRKVGRLTQAIFDKSVGDEVFIRGPYGNGFPITKLRGKNLIIISGGCGLAPMRSVIQYQLGTNFFSNLQILYGARTSQDILFSEEIDSWRKKIETIITVDKSDKNWRGNTGLITNLITSKIIQTDNSVAFICGPPVMYDTVTKKLISMGLSENQIYLSLERNMQCGVGLCQHCTCGDKYVCSDGPVFTLAESRKMEYKKD